MHILLNLKAYPVGPETIIEAVQTQSVPPNVRISVAPQTAAIQTVAGAGIDTWAQHTDGVDPGSQTGSNLAAALVRAGATGTLLNHSEHRLTLAALETGIEAAERAGLDTIVCANTPAQAKAAATLGADAVAIEPPALIGTGTPVSQADPAIVTDAIAAVTDVAPDVPVYCGAGISTAADVAAAAELGADGVLLASGVALAEDPADTLAGLVDGALGRAES